MTTEERKILKNMKVYRHYPSDCGGIYVKVDIVEELEEEKDFEKIKRKYRKKY